MLFLQWYSTSKYIYGQTHLTTNKKKKWLLTKQQRQKAKEEKQLQNDVPNTLSYVLAVADPPHRACCVPFALLQVGEPKSQRHRRPCTNTFLSHELSFLTYIFNSFCSINVVISDRATYESKSEKSQWEVCNKLVIHSGSLH